MIWLGAFAVAVVVAWFVLVYWIDTQLPKWEERLVKWMHPIRQQQLNRRQRRARENGTTEG